MHDFTHPYLSKIYPRWKAHPDGGMVIDAWFIVPNVNANPGDPFFAKQQIEELADAAVMHAKSKGLDCTIYVVGS